MISANIFPQSNLWENVSWYHLYFRLLKDTAATAAKSLQSCPTLCDPIDGSPPGSPVPGILQARTLEWVAMSFSNAWKWKVKVKLLSRVRPSATPRTAAFQAPLPMGFSKQEYWSGVPLTSLQEAQRTPQKTNIKKSIPRHFVFKLQKVKDRQNIERRQRNKTLYLQRS